MPLRKNISITSLCLDLQNPRQATNTQEEAFEWLCENVKVDELAQDIVKNGLNPLELIGVFKETNGLWCALEGNRRICALKLLNEPELAPTTKLKQKFKKMNAAWIDQITKIECVCFASRDEADIWLDRLHEGEQDGIGRKEWDAQQKARRTNRPENKRALMVLDYAKQMRWVNDADIDEKLTTATRYLNNDVLRQTLGLDSDITTLKRTRPDNVFNALLQQFINDLILNSVDGWVNSRGNKNKILEYAEHLNSSITDDSKNDAELVVLIPTPLPPKSTTPPKSPKPTKPPQPPKLLITHSQKLAEWLKAHGNTKLNSLYYSLCVLDLNDNNNTPLATVGAWSFVESLTRDCGRLDSSDFVAFVAGKYKGNTHLDMKAINKALKDLQELGNLTKHNGKYANFNGELIATIMNTATPAFISLLEEQVK